MLWKSGLIYVLKYESCKMDFAKEEAYSPFMILFKFDFLLNFTLIL